MTTWQRDDVTIKKQQQRRAFLSTNARNPYCSLHHNKRISWRNKAISRHPYCIIVMFLQGHTMHTHGWCPTGEPVREVTNPISNTGGVAQPPILLIHLFTHLCLRCKDPTLELKTFSILYKRKRCIKPKNRKHNRFLVYLSAISMEASFIFN